MPSMFSRSGLISFSTKLRTRSVPPDPRTWSDMKPPASIETSIFCTCIVKPSGREEAISLIFSCNFRAVILKLIFDLKSILMEDWRLSIRDSICSTPPMVPIAPSIGITTSDSTYDGSISCAEVTCTNSIGSSALGNSSTGNCLYDT